MNYINESDLFNITNNAFISYYSYNGKFCLAEINTIYYGSIISITPYFNTPQQATDYLNKPLDCLGINYYPHIVIVN